jgi:phosphosulfolactate synthase
MIKLPKRTQKPRTLGITSLNDTKLTIKEVSGMLDDYSDFIDIAKLGVGVAYVMPRLKDKIKLYKDNGVKVYFGGTLFEKFYSQNKLSDYKKFLVDNGIDIVEISTGTIDIELKERIDIINDFKESFTVIAEVGSKDPNQLMPPSEWIEEINSLIDIGCEYVITEGRDSGTSGIYRPSGELRDGLIHDIIKNTNAEKLIFEAPSTKLQMYFINLLGANVNLGNIAPQDVLILEAQRQSLRSETFHNYKE